MSAPDAAERPEKETASPGDPPPRGSLRDWFFTAGLIVAAAALERIVEKLIARSGIGVDEPVALASFVTRPEAWTLTGFCLVSILFCLAARYRDAAGRLLCVGPLAPLCWYYATFPFDPYYAEPQYGVRCAVAGLFVATVASPAFALPAITLCLVVSEQFDVLGWQSTTDKLLPMRLAFLAAAWAHARRIPELRVGAGHLAVAGLLMTAIHYVGPGFTKIGLAWWEHGHVYRIAASSFATGWLTEWPEETRATLFDLARRSDGVTVFGTLFVECGIAFALLRRWAAVGFLAASAGMHAIIFVLTGICFWKWAACLAVLLVAVVRMPWAEARAVFGLKNGLIGAAVVVAGVWVAKPPMLGWYDTRLSYSTHFVGIGRDGTEVAVPQSVLGPYQLRFSQDRWDFFHDRPTLVDACGCCGSEAIADRLEVTELTAENVDRLEAELGTSFRNEAKATRARRLLRNALTVEAPAPLRAVLGIVGTPTHIWHGEADAWDGSVPLREARIVLRRNVVLDNGSVEILSEEVVATVPLEGADDG